MPYDVTLCRHGETQWSASGQHTSFTDLPLIEAGVEQAKELGERLAGKKFARVLVSPLKRARQTCEIAGYSDVAEVVDDLTEWNYGDYEGITTDEIRKRVPDWSVFTHSSPGGESLEDVSARADHVLEIVRQTNGEVLIFSSGHFSRVLGARWLGLPGSAGRQLLLSTASMSILGWDREAPALKLWNGVFHKP